VIVLAGLDIRRQAGRARGARSGDDMAALTVWEFGEPFGWED
jgi:hypothetical protein